MALCVSNKLQEIANHSLPTCAKCHRQVDRIEQHQEINPSNPIHYDIVVIAFCHGEKEVVRIPNEMFDYVSRDTPQISFAGLAFQETKLIEQG